MGANVCEGGGGRTPSVKIKHRNKSEVKNKVIFNSQILLWDKTNRTPPPIFIHCLLSRKIFCYNFTSGKISFYILSRKIFHRILLTRRNKYFLHLFPERYLLRLIRKDILLHLIQKAISCIRSWNMFCWNMFCCRKICCCFLSRKIFCCILTGNRLSCIFSRKVILYVSSGNIFCCIISWKIFCCIVSEKAFSCIISWKIFYCKKISYCLLSRFFLHLISEDIL